MSAAESQAGFNDIYVSLTENKYNKHVEFIASEDRFINLWIFTDHHCSVKTVKTSLNRINKSLNEEKLFLAFDCSGFHNPDL